MVLGIDTSGLVCSVALVDKASLIGEFSLNHKKTHSEQLLPMTEYVLEKAEVAVSDLDAIAVANGPGSFTGLRIGAAAAKGMALVTQKPVIGVSSLLALAYNVAATERLIVPIMDARRNEVYTAAYSFKLDAEPFVSEVIEPVALPISELLDRLGEIGREVIFLGDGVPVYSQIIKDSIKVSYEFAPANATLQRASGVALLGERFLDLEEYNRPFSIEYIRRPQAERERLGL